MTFVGHPQAKVLLAGALAAGALFASPAGAQERTPERKELRVCQDPNNLPFSNDAAQGIENRIAELFGRELGLPVTYFSWPQRLAFVRNTLRYKLPGEDYRCDVLLDVPEGFDQVSITKPYYRSTYAIVYARGTGLDGVKSQADLLALPPDTLHKLRFGIYDSSPASDWLAKHDLDEQAVVFHMMSPDPDWYPGQIIDRELAGGKIDVAIVWGPIAGYFAKRSKDREMVVVPMSSEKNIKLDYAMAMGVRYGEPQWKKQIETLIDKRQPEIQAILRDFGVPLVPLASEPAAAGSAPPK